MKHHKQRHHAHKHSVKPPKLSERKQTPQNLIAPEHANPTAPETPRTDATKAANRAARARKLPARVSLRDLLTASRGIPTLTGQFADFESRRPVSLSDVLRGRVDLLED